MKILRGETVAVAPVRDSHILRNEWRSVFAVAALLFGVTSLPYLFAYAFAPPDRVFMGMALNVPDHAQYFSWLRSHADALLISNRMTSEPNSAVFFNLLWWALAGVGRMFALDYAGVYQVLRAGGVVSFVVVAYRMIAIMIADRRHRMFALLLTCCTSGFGWMLVLLKYTVAQGELYFPLDVYVAEGNTFLGALGSPHFLAAAAYVWCFELFLRALRRPDYASRRRLLFGCGLFAQFMGWQHAYDLLIVWGVLSVFAVLRTIAERAPDSSIRAVMRHMLRSRYLQGVCIVILISCPPAIYALALTRLDPLWGAVLAQFGNAGVWTPPLWRLPILFGVSFLAACAMIVRELRRGDALRSDASTMLTSWFLASFVLIYLPTDYQIHMLNGWQIPMSILAVRWIVEYAVPKIRAVHFVMRARFVAAAFLAVASLTNVYLFSWRILELSRHQYDFYLSRDEVSALHWLAVHADADDVVLSSQSIGQYVPMLTDSRAYLAHWAQTVDFYARRESVRRFFAADATQIERTRILFAHSVDFVFVGPAERSLPNFDPRATAGMRAVFSQGDVVVFAETEGPKD